MQEMPAQMDSQMAWKMWRRRGIGGKLATFNSIANGSHATVSAVVQLLTWSASCSHGVFRNPGLSPGAVRKIKALSKAESAHFCASAVWEPESAEKHFWHIRNSPDCRTDNCHSLPPPWTENGETALKRVVQIKYRTKKKKNGLKPLSVRPA